MQIARTRGCALHERDGRRQSAAQPARSAAQRGTGGEAKLDGSEGARPRTWASKRSDQLKSVDGKATAHGSTGWFSSASSPDDHATS